MPKINVNRSININASAEKVFNVLSDFTHWRAWSPWLIQEPEASNKVSEDGKFNEWEGERVGSGNMRITNEHANERLDMDLTFLKPWKSQAEVSFHLTPDDSTTRVNWTMNSSLPFFMFWMKKMMTEVIGMDYDRGLKMLKEYIEEDKVHSKLDFVGFRSFPGCKYVGIVTNTSMENIGSQMAEDFTRLGEFASRHEDLRTGVPFSIYHKWGIVNKKIKYTAGIPFTTIPNDVPEGMITSEIPATKTYTLKHTGSYQHLGNAWSTLQGLKRAKVFKMNNSIHPFETYATDPKEGDDKDQIVDIHFAVK